MLAASTPLCASADRPPPAFAMSVFAGGSAPAPAPAPATSASSTPLAPVPCRARAAAVVATLYSSASSSRAKRRRSAHRPSSACTLRWCLGQLRNDAAAATSGARNGCRLATTCGQE